MNGRSLLLIFLLAVLVLATLVITLALVRSLVLEVRPHTVRAISDNTLVDSTSQTVADVTGHRASSYERLWFTGDVMLSRQVGEFAREYGADYPWRGIAPLFDEHDAVLVNFEACVSAGMWFDWGEPMRFPVNPLLLPAVASSGVTHVSLANNHGLDCGAADYAYTKTQLRSVGITPFGHPMVVDEYSVATTTVGGYRVGIVALHTLFTEPDEAVLTDLTAALGSSTDIQVAFVHWGVEYEPSAHESQQSWARVLAEQGVDLIVGHHPHVVQNIEWVGDTLVIYSLGNLIFDQYFSSEVQEGLLAALEVQPTLQVRLMPVSSKAVRTQPALQVGESRELFLDELAAKSDASLEASIRAGVISLERHLATSTKPGMIAP